MLQLAVIQNHVEHTKDSGDGYTDDKCGIQPVPDSKRIEDKGKTEHTEKQPGRKHSKIIKIFLQHALISLLPIIIAERKNSAIYFLRIFCIRSCICISMMTSFHTMIINDQSENASFHRDIIYSQSPALNAL